MRKFGLMLLLLAALVPLVGQTRRDPLEAGFAAPPAEARVRCYWWWLNGHTDEAAITRDLEEMKAKGYAGAILVDANGSEQNGNRAVPAGPMFGTPQWRELYRHALREAARLGLEISLNIESGWNLGGPTVKPEHSTKLLTWSRAAVTGPREVRIKLEEPPARIGWYRDIAVLAYPLRHGEVLPARPIRDLAVKSASREMGMSAPRTMPLLEDVAAQPGEEDTRAAQVLDVSSHMQPDGSFAWSAPAGEWEILRIGYMASGAKVSTSSGAWQGLVIDYLDASEFARYWKENLDPLMEDAKPYLGKALRYLVTDSWELGGVNWTPRFREEFRARRGYDVLPWLPMIAGRIVDSRETSNRFLNDFRRTVGDLVIDGHYRPFAETAAKYGLGIHPESGGPHGAPIDALETLGVSTFPQMEFWARSRTHRVRDDERFFIKQGSSAAHTYGKTFVAAEGFTSIGPQWEESVWDDLKPSFDQAICAGLNRLFWHTFTSSPKSEGVPGQEYFAGTHMNPNVTWWSKAGAFTSYINRVQFLMQQGLPVSDVLVYYGDQVPNFVQWKGADPARVLPGYDYDVIDEHALTRRAHARDGRIVLPEGTSYAVLVLPERDSISPAALKKVRELVLAGAAVAGPKPVRTTGIGDDAAVRRIADEIWGRCGTNAKEMLHARGILPDFDGPADTDYVHRRAGGTDIYFVRNTRPEARRIEVTFRVKDRAPELWHAETGAIEAAGIYQATADGRTKMPLWLEPNGSVAVVFRHAPAPHAVAVTPEAAEVKITGTRELWTLEPGRYDVRLSTGRDMAAEVAAPAPVGIEGGWTVTFGDRAVPFPALRSWTENSDPEIHYCSGTARYRKEIEIPAAMLAGGHEAWLDLGEVREIAEVWLNGKSLGVLWRKPFAVALGSAAKPGANTLEIEVVNLWPNRLIGDASLPVNLRRTHTNIAKYKPDSPLMPSGLLGPVTLKAASRVPLK